MFIIFESRCYSFKSINGIKYNDESPLLCAQLTLCAQPWAFPLESRQVQTCFDAGSYACAKTCVYSKYSGQYNLRLAYVSSLALLHIAELRWACDQVNHLFQVISSQLRCSDKSYLKQVLSKSYIWEHPCLTNRGDGLGSDTRDGADNRHYYKCSRFVKYQYYVGQNYMKILKVLQ